MPPGCSSSITFSAISLSLELIVLERSCMQNPGDKFLGSSNYTVHVLAYRGLSSFFRDTFFSLYNIGFLCPVIFVSVAFHAH
jgi:hypothetical protein